MKKIELRLIHEKYLKCTMDTPSADRRTETSLRENISNIAYNLSLILSMVMKHGTFL
jgi:hypothetical protein